MLLPNVFDEQTFFKAPGEGKMVPTRVCLRVPFITISKSPAKRIQYPKTYFGAVTLSNSHVA